MEVPRHNCNSVVKYEPAEWVTLVKHGAVGAHDQLPKYSPKSVERWVREVNLVDITQVPPTLATTAWQWECPRGHRWQEPMYAITKRAKWKRHDPDGPMLAACRECVLNSYAAVYADCGHRCEDIREVANPPRTLPHAACKICPNPARDAARLDFTERKAAYEKKLAAKKRQYAAHLRTVANFDEGMEAASVARARTWSPVLPDRDFDRPLGSVEFNPGRFGSKLQDAVVAALVDTGIGVMTSCAVRVPDLYAQSGKTWLCTPDAIVGTICVEVDSPGYRHRTSTHASGFPARDLYRDDCLRAAGFQVVRLRLGSLEPVDDSVNLVTDKTHLTKALLGEFVTLVGNASSVAKRDHDAATP